MEEVIGIKDGIDIKKLVKNGVFFDVNNIQDALDQEIETVDSDEEHKPIDESNNYDPLGKFNKEPFEELWKKMESIESNDLIRKQIVQKGSGQAVNDKSFVKILFCMYFDGKNKPFTSTKKFSPYVVRLENSGLLIGTEISIRSMAVGEHSRFLIHHSLMYGELGCPPHIPKKAMCLLHCVIMSVSAEEAVTETNLCDDGFEIKDVFKVIKNLFDKGIRSYNSGNIHFALSTFNKAVSKLEQCTLANEEEEKLQKDFLLKIYLNLAICYNKLNSPFKACSMCNEYNRIKPIWHDWKILFQNAKALMMIGVFKDARRKMLKSRQLNPHSEEIKKYISILNEKESLCRNYESELAKFVANKEKNNDYLKGFKEELKSLCNAIKNDPQLNRLTLNLPNGLTEPELELIKNIMKKEDLSLEFNNSCQNNTPLTISKSSTATGKDKGSS